MLSDCSPCGGMRSTQGLLVECVLDQRWTGLYGILYVFLFTSSAFKVKKAFYYATSL